MGPEEIEEVSYLAVETAKSCEIVRSDGKYQLISDSVSEDTYVFAGESTVPIVVPTNDFVDSLDTFDEDFSFEPPMAALTLLSSDESKEPTTVVVAIEKAKNVDGKVVYDISQPQTEDGTLDSLYDGVDSDTVSYESVSIFVDNISPRFITCPLCRGAVDTLFGVGGPAACTAVCALSVILAPFCPFVCAAIFGVAGPILNPNQICGEIGLC